MNPGKLWTQAIVVALADPQHVKEMQEPRQNIYDLVECRGS
jgi:hypothetical protein